MDWNTSPAGKDCVVFHLRTRMFRDISTRTHIGFPDDGIVHMGRADAKPSSHLSVSIVTNATLPVPKQEAWQDTDVD